MAAADRAQFRDGDTILLGFNRRLWDYAIETPSYLIGVHVQRGSALAEGMGAQMAAPFSGRQTGLGDSSVQGFEVLAVRVQRQAYVLAHVDALWLIAWVLLAGIVLVLLLPLPRSPPNPLTPH